MKSIGRFCFLVLASGMALAQANPPSSSTVADDLKAMREAIAAQQKQIAQQQQQIESLTKALDAKTTVAPHVENAALTNNAPVNNTPNIQSDVDKPKESPLSFRIGGAEFTLAASWILKTSSAAPIQATFPPPTSGPSRSAIQRPATSPNIVPPASTRASI